MIFGSEEPSKFHFPDSRPIALEIGRMAQLGTEGGRLGGRPLVLGAVALAALRVEPDYVDRLEVACDTYNEQLAALRSFVLPAGTPLSAALHVSRTVTRRAERSTWAALDAHGDSMNPLTAKYLNRGAPTGGAVMPTLDCYAMRVAAGAATRARRSMRERSRSGT